jgi:hypothetical protein
MEQTIDDTETILVKIISRIKQPRITRKVMGYNAISIPTIVATPLPPLNEANRGNTCPKTAAEPNMILYISS